MIGYNQESKHTTGFNAGREQLISNDLGSLSYATGDRWVGSSDNSWATRSGFFRINYGYDERYLLEVNGRYDLSSKFPKHDRAVFTPSFSAAWRLSNESWFKSWTNSFFDELKIRGSYGSLGNQALNNGWYAYLSNYSTGQISWIMGSNQPQYVVPGGLVSSSITWETVTQWDLGLDFNFLNSRLKGAFDYYQRRTSDILAAGKILPGVLGANEPQENAAESLTKGWEFEISWNDQLANGFHYTVGFNLSDYQSEVTKFDNESKELGNWYVGQKQGEIWGYETYGLFQSEQEIAGAANQDKVSGGIKLMPGDIRFVDRNNDGVIDWGDNTVDNPGDKKSSATALRAIITASTWEPTGKVSTWVSSSREWANVTSIYRELHSEATTEANGKYLQPTTTITGQKKIREHISPVRVSMVVLPSTKPRHAIW